MSLHAAAGIAMAVENFKGRGYASLGGLILNRRNVKREEEKVQELAEDFSTEVIAFLERSDLVTEAEEMGMCVLEAFPESDAANGYRILADAMLEKLGLTGGEQVC
jgi:nitrogenase iron protein NifH